MAHSWAGAVTQVGCDEISKNNLEAVLKQNRPDSLTQTREALQQLARSFAEESIDNQVRGARGHRLALTARDAWPPAAVLEPRVRCFNSQFQRAVWARVHVRGSGDRESGHDSR